MKIIGHPELKGSVAHYARPHGTDLLTRTRKFGAYVDLRQAEEVFPYSRSLVTAVGPEASIKDDTGRLCAGLNFASQDYLAMNTRVSVCEVAKAAIVKYGVHSAGSPALLGNTVPSLALEKALQDFLQTEHVLLFPTGWAAAFGTIVALVRAEDHVVMDELSHASLQSGIFAVTHKVARCKHLDVDAMINAIKAIRAADTKNGILAVTESLFSMDSDTPDLDRLQNACREFDATLMIDVAHDLGALGPGGLGHLGIQKLVGKADLVMGSFSKTFASNGGFLATHSHDVRNFVKFFGGSHTFSNAISPVQSSIVKKVLDIVQSPEGEELRQNLLSTVKALRDELKSLGFESLGDPSAIVPVPIGSEAVARVASKLLFKQGVLLNLVEFPAVKIGAARFRLQVMASHTKEQAIEAARKISACVKEAREIVQSFEEQA